MDPLIRLGYHRFDSEQRRALGGPVPTGTGSILLTRHDDQRSVPFGVGRCRVEYRDHHVVTLREVDGEATLDSGEHQILQADVRERAANHDFVVASPRTVGVEVRAFYAVLTEVLSCRTVGLDRTGR